MRCPVCGSTDGHVFVNRATHSSSEGRWEARKTVAEHGSVVAYGFTRRSARRHLKRMLQQ